MKRALDRPSIVRSATTGAIVVFLTMGFDAMVDPHHPHGLWFLLFNDLLLGLAVAIIVLIYEQRRRRELARKLQVIAEMNHTIRNQLEIIQYSAYSTKEKQHVAIIGESIAKIEAALIEILEGRKKTPPPPRAAGADR